MPFKLAHLLNTEEPESDVEGVLNLAYKDEHHGLMTPLSSDTMSPHSEHEPSVAVCSEAATSDYRRSALESRFPGMSWVDLVGGLGDVPNGLSKPEMDLVVAEWYRPGPINYESLEKQCALRTMRQIHTKIGHLEDTYGSLKNELDESHISTFETCHDLALYLIHDVASFLPDMSSTEIRKLFAAHFPYKPRWLPGEINYITECLKSGESLDFVADALVLRTQAEAKTKYDSTQRKLLAVAAAPPPPVILTPEEKEHLAQISWFIEKDLTLSGIKSVITDGSHQQIINDILAEIARLGGSQKVPFTKTETDFLRGALQQKRTPRLIHLELPFRSEAEIEEKLKKLEIACVRQKKFANDIERLIYEAQWYASMADETTGGRKRRHTRDAVGLQDLKEEAVTKKKTRVELTAEELEEKQIASKIRREKLAENRKKRAEEKELLKRQRLESPKPRVIVLRGHKQKQKQRVSELLEDAKWFQSVTGDGSCVKQGEKRKRKQAYHLVPEFQNRLQLKLAQRKLVEKKIEKGSKRKRSSKLLKEELSDSESDSDTDELKELQEAMKKTGRLTEIEEVSPFDPVDILHDTIVPLNGRQLFNDAIASGATRHAQIEFSSNLLMLEADDLLPLTNKLAVEVIKDNVKSYKSMPLTFPPLKIVGRSGKSDINPANLVSVRYLLYTQHTEQFVLAHPKSNELDSIFELQKIFQIHFALYFSHSPVLKKIIYEDYCTKLSESVSNNDFSAFMVVIDKWNALMLELSPYSLQVDPAVDINKRLRKYLSKDSWKQPTALELKLTTFFFEISLGDKSSPSNVVKAEKLDSILGPTTWEGYKTAFHDLRPMTYSKTFINLLNQMEGISRFSVQQLLLRAYTRIVSPDSKKLRSYKAFTAEVYGELLPSFVSEVLSKVGLTPDQKFYDLGSGVGNTTFQAALEFGVKDSGGCEIMKHASKLTSLQDTYIKKQMKEWGLNPLNLSFALLQSFVDNEEVRKKCVDCNVLIVNNYLFDFPLNVEVGKLLYGLKPGSKIISLRNFIPPRYKAGEDKTVLDYLKVEKFEMSDYLSVSWTANKVPYYISTVEKEILPEYL